ncbi:hypothetical protein S40288_05669 [Stachybotrys chartarum IBT 40288]|nr:hypothetical protein S40288_05669 [Stachybotrys chartarum IBT 40288]
MKKSGHRDKKWSEWIYDETYNQCYRYRQGRNGEYEYVWQAPPAEETRNTPKTTPSVEEELTQGLSKLDIGHDDAEAAKISDQLSSSGYVANGYQEASGQSAGRYDEPRYDDNPSPHGPAYPEAGEDAYRSYHETEDYQQSHGGQHSASYAKPMSPVHSYHSSSKHSKGKGKELRDDETQFPPQHDGQQYHQQYGDQKHDDRQYDDQQYDEELYEADDSTHGQPLANSTAYPYTEHEDYATGSSSGNWTTENADDTAEYEDEALQAAKLDSKRYHRHPKGPDGSGPSSDSAYYYAQTPDPLAIHEGGLSSDSTHVYAEAQGSHGKDPGGRTTPKPGDYGSVLTIQNMLRDKDLLDPRYRVEHTDKFQPGEIFKVHWAQPRGADIKDSTTDERTFVDDYGDLFHFGFRRFVVVANDLGHSQCVPILTYNGQACRKKGVKPKKHGIIYQQGQKPRLLPGEPALGFAPVKMQMTSEDEKLTKESRVNYSKLNTVEHNVKVFFIGRIATDADWEIFSEAVNYCWEQMTHFKRRRK